MQNINSIREANAIEMLKEGDDSAIRQYYAARIDVTFAKSESGLIGWGQFVEEIKELIHKMEAQCKEHWPE